MPETTWIFAYGSLLWKPGFTYAEARPAFVRGWARRFWQGSTDHRGTEAAPGRVVTLVESDGAQCWGLAYRLAPTRAAETLRMLDHRERGGYCRLVTRLHFAANGEETEPGLLYLARPRNRNYLG
ncbi:MAG: gamma-glutamylcyclotransferase, partial [Deltaproteobacteria bacterium]|nr:gamma-glutamylcyclotransferase [Deltaproteobacteria bacterium]